MEGKDDRHKSKRSKMHQYKKTNAYQKTKAISPRSSHGLIDVADSSDDRISNRFVNKWKNSSSPSASEIEELEENDQVLAGDFELLQETPLSVGSHFQFSSEKIWDSDENQFDKSEPSLYFTLNLKLLNAGLETLPFFKRMDYPSLMFTKAETDKMINLAEENEIKFQDVIKDLENNSKIKQKNAGSRKSSGKSISKGSSVKVNQKDADAIPETINDGVDELLNITNSVEKLKVNDTISQDKTVTTAPKTVNPNEANNDNNDDIQKWLDNVLED